MHNHFQKSYSRASIMLSRGLLLLFIVGTNAIPQFAIHESRSIESTPTIDVTFENGYTDRFVLDNFYFAEEDRLNRRDNCDYIGHLAGDLNTCVAVTGCVGSDPLEITMIGDQGGLYRMDLNGLVSRIQPDFNRIAKLDRDFLDNPDWWGDGDDLLTDPDTQKEEDETAKECSKIECKKLPQTQLLELQILYNTPLLTKMGGSQDKVLKLINSVMTHVQAYYCHSSLGSKVRLQQSGASGVKYYKEPDWIASEDTLKRLAEIAETDLADSKANLFVGLTFDDETHGKNNNAGLAWGKAVCHNRDWSMSINEWDPDMTTFANTVAHEIGHNLGMEHDHEPNHKAKGCDKQGIMSYGGNWIEWSTCSRDDFTNHFRTMVKKNGFWCLPKAPSACNPFAGSHSWF